MRTIPREQPDPLRGKFSLPDKPGESVPELPRHLDDLSDTDLMEAYREFMSWLFYAKAELVKAEIAEEREDHGCRTLEARVLIEQWGADSRGDRVTIAKARRDVDNRVVAQRDEYLKARAYRKLVESVYDRCDKATQLLSRELTRRTSTFPRDNRYGKVGA